MVFYYIKIALYAIIGLGILVFIHELGHFIGARLVKIPVEKFSIGWGKALVKKQIGQTTFQIGWLIIIGGYCKMKGQDDFAKDEPDSSPDSFYGRPAWARLVAVFGGPFFSYLFAILLFAIILMFNGKWDLNYTRIAVNPKDAGSYALQTGDIITSVNNKKVNTWNNLKEILVNNTETNMLIGVQRGVLNINDVPINSYKNFFDTLKKIKNPDNFNVEEKFTSHIVAHNQSMARLATPFKDIMVYTDSHPIVHSISNEVDTPANGYLFPGDILLTVNKIPVFQFEELVHFINDFKENNPNLVPVFQVYRKGKKVFTEQEIKSSIGTDFENIKKYLIKTDKGFSFKPETNEETLVPKLKSLFRQTLEGVLSVPINPTKKDNRYIVGIQIMPQAEHLEKFKNHIPIGFFESWALGFTQTNNAIILNVKGIIRLIRGDIPVKGSVGGPIKIFTMLGQMGASQGILSFLSFVALISALLAFANMLPIPAVDGSHIILSIIEIIRRKNFSPVFIRRFQTVGLVTIILLLLVVTYLDIFSLF